MSSKSDAPTASVEPSEQADSDIQPAERIQTLDFSQPTKFTTEIRRRISSAIDQFCEALSARLSSELQTEVLIGVSEVDQLTWAAAKAQLPVDSVAVAVPAVSIERQMLLSVEPPLLAQALECLLGGQASQAPAARRLSEIDWALARGLLDGILAELSSAWEEIGGPELTRGEIDMEGDAEVLSPVGEPTFSVALQSTIDGQSAGMSLLIPWSAVEPVAESIRGAIPHQPTVDTRGPLALRRGIAGVQVLLRAEVGSTQMPIERMLELVPGALVGLQGRAEDGVLLFAEGVSVGRGKPGRSGARRAIKLQSTGETPTKADTYAKLGRAELQRARAHAADTAEGVEGRTILRSIFVQVWAELGRTHLPLGHTLELTAGAVVELDQYAEAPVELFVNGLCFANGSLVVTAEGGWGVQVQELL